MSIMSFLTRWRGQKETRGVPSADDDFWYSELPSFSASGVKVTPDSAMRSAAVFGCVKVISQAIAALPIITYKRKTDGGKERDRRNPIFPILGLRPNRFQSKTAFIENIMEDLLLRGNHYSHVITARGGEVRQIVPLHPDRVEIRQLETGFLEYSVRRDDGTKRAFKVDEVLHIRGHGCRGFVGLSPIQAARETVGLALAAEDHGARFFSNGTNLQGVLEHPEQLDDETAKRIAKSWKKAFSGTPNAFKTAVLEQGMKYQRLTMNNVDAQFIEARRFQLEEICRIFSVPPHMLADLSRATFSNIEHLAIHFVVHTLMPWINKIEEAFQIYLFGENNEEEFAEFLVHALLRGDTLSRNNSYSVGRQWGWLSVNDVRRLENLDPIGDAGDIYLSPLNMIPAEKAKDVPVPGMEAPADPELPAPDEQNDDDIRPVRLNSFLPVFEEILLRFIRREKKSGKEEPIKLEEVLRSSVSVAIEVSGGGETARAERALSRFVESHMSAERNSAILSMTDEAFAARAEAEKLIELIREELI